MKTASLVLGIAFLLLFLHSGCVSKPSNNGNQTVNETTTTFVTLTTVTTSTTSSTSSTTTSTTTTTSSSTTTTFRGKKCWNASNGYLDYDIQQMNKFCKCASGFYAHKSYYRAGLYAAAYSYMDFRNNEDWYVRRIPATYSPLYYVVCYDNRTYWTNQTYYR